MSTHDCKQEGNISKQGEDISKLLILTAKIDQAICGNGVPGIHDRLTSVEGDIKGIYAEMRKGINNVAAVACVIGLTVGSFIGVVATVIKITTA